MEPDIFHFEPRSPSAHFKASSRVHREDRRIRRLQPIWYPEGSEKSDSPFQCSLQTAYYTFERLFFTGRTCSKGTLAWSLPLLQCINRYNFTFSNMSSVVLSCMDAYGCTLFCNYGFGGVFLNIGIFRECMYFVSSFLWTCLI